MKKQFILLLIIFGSAKLVSAQKAEAILGIWLNADKDAKVEIYQSGNKYNGRIVWIKNTYEPDGKTPRKDSKNPDNKLRGRNIDGLVILTNFQYDDGEWNGGKIYDPKNGKTYSSKMELEGGKLNIRGYIGISLIGRTTVWTRSRL
jgi:uncharacterized protein (DUF2147 family)